MYHIQKEEIPKSYFPKVGRLEVGQYYALLSYDNIYCFAHVLETTEDFFVAETFYANFYNGEIVYLQRKKGSFQLTHKMQFSQFYFYFINNDNSEITFGYVSDEISFHNRIYEVIEIDLVKDFIVTWRLTDFNEHVNDYCYSIEPKTFDKAKKLFDMLDHCIATFMKSYLE